MALKKITLIFVSLVLLSCGNGEFREDIVNDKNMDTLCFDTLVMEELVEFDDEKDDDVEEQNAEKLIRKLIGDKGEMNKDKIVLEELIRIVDKKKKNCDEGDSVSYDTVCVEEEIDSVV